MNRASRAGAVLFVLVLSVYVSTTGGSFATDLASYEVTRNLVEHGSVAMSYNLLETEAERGVDGRYYAPVGIGHPLFGVPFYGAARLLQRASGLKLGKPESLTKAAVVTGSAVAAAGCVYVAFLFALHLGGTIQGAVLTALALALGTPLWPYSKFGFNAPLAALCLLGGAYGAWIGVRHGRRLWLFVGGVSLGCGVLTRHEMSAGALPVVLWLWHESRGNRRALVERGVAFGVPVAVAVALWMLYNFSRFGHPLDTGLMRDPNVSFDTPLLVGLHGLLLSAGRSLFVYAPLTMAGVWALARMWKTDRGTALFLGAFPVVFLLIYAKMRQWDGGESYGPRYLVPIIAFLILPLTRCFDAGLLPLSRRLLGAACVISIAAQLPGVMVDFSKIQQEYARSRSGYSIALTRYTWEAAPLTLNTRAVFRAIPENLRYLTGRAHLPDVRLTATEEAHDFSQQFGFSLDFWWLYLHYLGAVSVPVALILGGVPLLVAAGCGWYLLGTLRTAPSGAGSFRHG